VNRLTPAALALALAACGGNAQQLPVKITSCKAVPSAQGADLRAMVENKAYKPISELDFSAAFYGDFRYRKFAGAATLPQEFDPGQKREIVAPLAGATPDLHGPAMVCLVTRIRYLDGTVDVAPAQE